MTAVSDETGIKSALIAFVRAYGSQECSTKGLDDALAKAKAALLGDGYDEREVFTEEERQILTSYMATEPFTALSASPVGEPALRMCGYCKTWNSKPCGEQCYLQPSDPVWTAPVAQEPVATKATQQASADFLHEEMIKLGSPLTYTACLTLTKRITDTNTLAWAGEVNKLCTEIGSLKNEIAALKSAANPPATPAGLGADEIARALYEMQPVEDRSDENGDPIPWDGLADFCHEVHFEEAKRFTSALLSRGSGLDQK